MGFVGGSEYIYIYICINIHSLLGRLSCDYSDKTRYIIIIIMYTYIY